MICITHLAQIAAYADEQLVVCKSIENEKTKVQVVAVTDKSREEEIARMLGGETITDKTRAYAKELLSNRVD